MHDVSSKTLITCEVPTAAFTWSARHDRRGAPLIRLAHFDYLVRVAVTITEHGGEVKVMMLH